MVERGALGPVHAERPLPGGGVCACGCARTEFQPLLTLGEPEPAGVCAGEEAGKAARAGARRSASLPSVLVVVVTMVCERRFAGARVSMRRINCTLR